MRKKLCFLCACALVICSLSGCGGSNNNNNESKDVVSSNDTKETSGSKTEKKVEVDPIAEEVEALPLNEKLKISLSETEVKFVVTHSFVNRAKIMNGNNVKIAFAADGVADSMYDYTALCNFYRLGTNWAVDFTYVADGNQVESATLEGVTKKIEVDEAKRCATITITGDTADHFKPIYDTLSQDLNVDMKDNLSALEEFGSIKDYIQ